MSECDSVVLDKDLDKDLDKQFETIELVNCNDLDVFLKVIMFSDEKSGQIIRADINNLMRKYIDQDESLKAKLIKNEYMDFNTQYLSIANKTVNDKLQNSIIDLIRDSIIEILDRECRAGDLAKIIMKYVNNPDHKQNVYKSQMECIRYAMHRFATNIFYNYIRKTCCLKVEKIVLSKCILNINNCSISLFAKTNYGVTRALDFSIPSSKMSDGVSTKIARAVATGRCTFISTDIFD